MSFTEIFGGTTIAPSNASFLLLPMVTDIDLEWPIEQAMSGLVVADTIEVQATAPGLSINFPDARQVSTGYTTCLNNTGGETVSVLDAGANQILSLVPGSAWVIYLQNNSTEAGIWRIFQLGASVSVAVAAALAGAGLKAIGATLNQAIPVVTVSTTPVVTALADRARMVNWTGGVGILNLPDPAVVGSDWFIQVRNSGTGDLTVTPTTGSIDGSVNKTFGVDTSATIVTDGANYFTLGFGSGAGGAGSFDFTTVDIAGSGDFVLAGANLNRIAYRFTGVLTGNRTVIVPGSIQQYWVTNATTGAFTLSFRTAAQTPPGVQILQNNAAILYCDGNNVVNADSATVTFPIPVALGGTGAVNAGVARTNLGVPPLTRAINTGFGLTGGGDLSADRTLALAVGALAGVVRKTTTTTKTNDVTRASDPELLFAALPAGTYIIRGTLSMQYNGGSQGMAFQLAGANITPLGENMGYLIGIGAALSFLVAMDVTSATAGVSQASVGGPSGTMTQFEAYIVLSNTSNIDLQWAQASSSATPTSIVAGSWMTYLRVA